MHVFLVGALMIGAAVLLAGVAAPPEPTCEPVTGPDAVKANFEQVEKMWFPYI